MPFPQKLVKPYLRESRPITFGTVLSGEAPDPMVGLEMTLDDSYFLIYLVGAGLRILEAEGAPGECPGFMDAVKNFGRRFDIALEESEKSGAQEGNGA